MRSSISFDKYIYSGKYYVTLESSLVPFPVKLFPKCPSPETIKEWISTMLPIHTREYYSAMKRKDVLIHAAMWMNFKNVMLSEGRKIKRPRIVRFHLYKMSRIGKSWREKVDALFTGGLGVEGC